MDELALLDAALAATGKNLRFSRRISGGPVSITVKAQYRENRRPNQVVSGSYDDSFVIVTSPTGFNADPGWITGQSAPGDPMALNQLFPRKGDLVNINGRDYSITSALYLAVGETVVRINLMASGAMGGI